jgi:hypothetical protein
MGLGKSWVDKKQINLLWQLSKRIKEAKSVNMYSSWISATGLETTQEKSSWFIFIIIYIYRWNRIMNIDKKIVALSLKKRSQKRVNNLPY